MTNPSVGRFWSAWLTVKRLLLGAVDAGIRIGLFLVSIVFAWCVQLLLFGTYYDSEAWLRLIVLTFAFHALLETTLRYALMPDVRLVATDRSGCLLGPDREVKEDDLEGYELQRANHQNYLRNFEILRFEVQHRRPRRVFRALGPRLAIQGAAVRFRYRRYPEEASWTDWRYGRWDGVPQPLVGGKLDLRALETNHLLPLLYPKEEPERLAFAMKQIGADEFYHFNDASYQFIRWRNPEWVFRSGMYEVEAEVTGHGLSWYPRCTFWLESDWSGFRTWKKRPDVTDEPGNCPVEHLCPSVTKKYQDGGQFRDLLDRVLRLQEENFELRQRIWQFVLSELRSKDDIEALSEKP